MEDEIFLEEPEKNSTFKKVSLFLLNFIIIAVGVFLIYNIYKISGIENKIRYIAMGVIAFMDILLVIVTRVLTKKPSKTKTAIAVIISLLIIVGEAFVGYFIYRTYSSVNNMNKDKITYTTVIATRASDNIKAITDLKNKRIGIVVDETSIDGYVIGIEILEEQKLESNNKVSEYSNVSEMVRDLYSKKIDAMIVSKNYPTMFKSIEAYENIESDTKIIYSKSKTLTKEEAKKYTGEETTNFNTSDKIDKPFTLLVMGVDSDEKVLSKNVTSNGDALMLVTFNPDTLNATILSIPRDTYVPIACFSGQRENKITHAAWNGESCMIKTIENFTGIDIDYYVKINFQGVIGLVNSLGGIEVDVPIEFCESNAYRSTDEKDLICLKKGKQKLTGEQALALARHRKTLATGDLQRGVNQQIVVQGILNKIKSVRSTTQLLKVLDTVSKSMDTNFTTKQILSFYDIAKKLIKTSSNSNSIINMTQLYLSGSDQMIYDEGIGLVLYNYIPSKESLNLIVKAMKENLGLEKVSMIKKFDFNIEEPFEMKTIGAGVYGGAARYSLLPSVVGKSESDARGILGQLGLSVTTQTKEVSASDGYFDGQVIDQSYPAGKRIDMISGSITLTVAKISGSNESTEENKDTTEEKPQDAYPVCDKTDQGYVDDGTGTCVCPEGKIEEGGSCIEKPTEDPPVNPENPENGN